MANAPRFPPPQFFITNPSAHTVGKKVDSWKFLFGIYLHMRRLGAKNFFFIQKMRLAKAHVELNSGKLSEKPLKSFREFSQVKRKRKLKVEGN